MSYIVLLNIFTWGTAFRPVVEFTWVNYGRRSQRSLIAMSHCKHASVELSTKWVAMVAIRLDAVDLIKAWCGWRSGDNRGAWICLAIFVISLCLVAMCILICVCITFTYIYNCVSIYIMCIYLYIYINKITVYYTVSNASKSYSNTSLLPFFRGNFRAVEAFQCTPAVVVVPTDFSAIWIGFVQKIGYPLVRRLT